MDMVNNKVDGVKEDVNGIKEEVNEAKNATVVLLAKVAECLTGINEIRGSYERVSQQLTSYVNDNRLEKKLEGKQLLEEASRTATSAKRQKTKADHTTRKKQLKVNNQTGKAWL